MRSMRQTFPKATHFAQVRLFGPGGSVVTVEGPVTPEEYKEIFANAIGKDAKKVMSEVREEIREERAKEKNEC